MTAARTVPCRVCEGTGAARAATGSGREGRSEGTLLREELARAWGVVGMHEQFSASIYETAGAAITELVDKVARQEQVIASLNQTNARLKRELAARVDRLGDGAAAATADGDAAAADADPKMTRSEYRLAAAAYEAEKNGGDPGGAGRRKGTGGQAGHKGSSRRGAVDEVVHFFPELCSICGRADMAITRTVRKRVYDLAEARQKTVSRLYMMRAGLCPACGVLTLPHTDAIPGTSFGPLLRAHVHTYREGHATEGDIRRFLEGIECASFSEGAISSCVSAIAGYMDGRVITVPDEEPVVLGASDDLRDYRSPLPPARPDCTEYGMIDAALTQRSNLWTSSLPPPVTVRIVQRASMDPYACSDETGNRVGADGVQTSVMDTAHTTQIHIIRHRDAATLRTKWGWTVHRPAMRDGTSGYEWHTRQGGRRSRCMVHILRDAEESAMEYGLGSPQYVRHRAMLDVYRDAGRIREEVIDRAGGPLTCASQLGRIDRVQGLARSVDEQIRRLAGRVTGIIRMSTADSVSTTISNALPDMFCALRVPGMPLHNNGTERTIRDKVVVDRRRVRYPDMKGARNFSVMRTVSATCEKNGVRVHHATIMMAKDPTWDIFHSGIPPPIFGTTGDGAIHRPGQNPRRPHAVTPRPQTP